MGYQESNNISQDDLAYWLRAIPAQYDKYGQAINNLREQLKSSDEKVSALEEKIKDIEKIEDKATQNLGAVQRDIKNVRNKTLEPLAVFVGLFTFVSVSFSALSNIDPSLWTTILLLIAGMMVIFAGLVIHVGSLESDDKYRRYWTAGLIVVGLMILFSGVFLQYSMIWS